MLIQPYTILNSEYQRKAHSIQAELRLSDLSSNCRAVVMTFKIEHLSCIFHQPGPMIGRSI
ncbi:hypothetical protein VCHA34P126_100002 [Vibrio chagasii]|nr:hypothetical protein VCHA34P126_100002 [Vibrio chagasii]CAH7066740.1 hypothetical protein VCHA51O444_160002 [Vibrio chagasii]